MGDAAQPAKKSALRSASLTARAPTVLVRYCMASASPSRMKPVST